MTSCKTFNYTKADHRIGIRRQNKNDLKAWFGDWLKKKWYVAIAIPPSPSKLQLQLGK